MKKLEHALGAARKRADDLASDEELARDLVIIRSKLAAWLVLTLELAGLLHKYGHFKFEIGNIVAYLRNAVSEIEVALGASLSELDNSVVGIAEGREKAPPKPAQPVLKVITPAPEPQFTLFALQPLRYQQNGQQKLVARHGLAEGLTDAQRRMALELKIACTLDDARIPDLRKRQISQHVQVHHTYNLDDGTPPPGALIMDLPPKNRDYRLPSNYEPKGAADVRLPIAAARSTEKDEDK
jgi:hypothetical protein